jgi:HEAT repeat protein
VKRWIIAALAATLAWCLASRAALAAEDAPDPLLAKPMADLKKTVESSDSELNRILAAEAIAKLLKPPAPPKRKGVPAAAVRQLTAAERELALEAAAVGIGDSSCAVRHYSQKALTALDAEAIPTLKTTLADAQIDKLQAACLALYDIGNRRSQTDPLPASVVEVVPGLVKALQHDSYVVREAAAMACRGLGPAAATALPQIIELLDDEEFSVANAAVYAVAAVDPSGKKSVPALVKALDAEHDLREFVCVELGSMGQDARSAVPALAKLVQADRNNWHAGNAACKALMKIVVFKPKDAEGNPVEDKTATVRPIAIAAIVDGALNHETDFCRWNCYNSLFLDSNVHCPFGDEIRPLIPKVLADLREYMAMTPTKWWPPRKETCDLAVRIAQSDPKQKEKIVALIKELFKDDTTEEGGVVELEKMLKALED